MRLLAAAGLCVGGVSSAGAFAGPEGCVAGPLGGAAGLGHRVRVDAACRVQIVDADSRVLSEVELRPAAREVIRRILPASSILFVLRDSPGRLEAYRLPTLQPIALVGVPTLRAPQDLAVRVGSDGSLAGYVLDNPPPFAYHDSDLPAPQPEVLRFALRPHESDRGMAMVARAMGTLAGPSTASGWRALERLDLLPTEVRVVVREARGRYAEHFTDDGVFVERVPLADGVVLSSPR